MANRKQDSLLDNIRGLLEKTAAVKGKPFKFKKPPRVFPPLVPQRAYLQDLKPVLIEMKRIVGEIIKPSLGPIIKQAVAVRPTSDGLAYVQDDFVDLIDQAFNSAKIKFYRKYTDGEIANLARRAARRTDGFNLGQLNKVFGVVLNVSLPGGETWLNQEIKAFTKTNVDLIKSIPSQYFTRVEQQVMQAAQRGALQDDFAASLNKAYKVGENRAALIARDQVSKFNSNLTRIRQQSVGITEYVWSTSLDERVRDSHAEKEGDTFSWDDPPADTGNPGEDIQCRCVALPVFAPSKK